MNKEQIERCTEISRFKNHLNNIINKHGRINKAALDILYTYDGKFTYQFDMLLKNTYDRYQKELDEL